MTILQKWFTDREEASVWLGEQTSQLDAGEIDWVGFSPTDWTDADLMRVTIALKAE